MLYFRCKYYNHCGGDSCAKCLVGEDEKKKDLLRAMDDHSLLLPATPTANELYVAIQKAKEKYGRKK